ncbi:MAG: hypothetical protein R3F11_29090 [Verrucomicrobiales bacterium]
MNDFLTFTFATPVQLQPDTVYGFDIGTTGSGFIDVGERRYRHAAWRLQLGANSVGAASVTFRGRDRVFHADLEAVVPPARRTCQPAADRRDRAFRDGEWRGHRLPATPRRRSRSFSPNDGGNEPGRGRDRSILQTPPARFPRRFPGWTR